MLTPAAHKISPKLLALSAGAALAAAASAPAAMLDLTQANSSATLGGAIFSTTEVQPTGTGVINPFVRIQMNGLEEGYNPSAPSLPFDEKAGIWTHDLRLVDMGTQ